MSAFSRVICNTTRLPFIRVSAYIDIAIFRQLEINIYLLSGRRPRLILILIQILILILIQILSGLRPRAAIDIDIYIDIDIDIDIIFILILGYLGYLQLRVAFLKGRSLYQYFIRVQSIYRSNNVIPLIRAVSLQIVDLSIYYLTLAQTHDSGLFFP